MAFSQTFAHAYSVTFGTNGAITLNPSSPKGPITVTDSGTDDISRLGDVLNDDVAATGLNNGRSIYYGSAVVGSTPGIILSDQNGQWRFLTNTQFTATTAGTATKDGAWPPPPASLALVNDTGASASDGVTSSAAIKGTALAGSTVTLTIATPRSAPARPTTRATSPSPRPPARWPKGRTPSR